MSRIDIHTMMPPSPCTRAAAPQAPLEEFAVTVTVTPRMPVAAARVYTIPTVREIPPVPRSGISDSTW